MGALMSTDCWSYSKPQRNKLQRYSTSRNIPSAPRGNPFRPNDTHALVLLQVGQLVKGVISCWTHLYLNTSEALDDCPVALVEGSM